MVGRLDGRVAIVTGGAKGLGRAYGLGLAREGCSVVVADLRDGGPVADEIVSAGGSAAAVQVDVADRGSTEAMARFTGDRFGRIDVLVNNAAHYMAVERGHFSGISVEDWDRAFAVNVRGPWLCSRAVYPYMQRQRYGKIINISSMTVVDGTVDFLHYVATKAAVIGLTRSLAREVGDDNISVNTVTPDYIPHDADYASREPEVDAILSSRRCFKRTQTPEDMVGTIVFLAGPGSDFVTGQNFTVNGGRAFL